MFCSNCGSPMKEDARFCGNCGAGVASPVSTPTPSATSFLPSVTPLAPALDAQSKCPWCGEITSGRQSSCPRCGATLNERILSTRSGWTQLPGRRDMAKLQFGNSFCQIEGLYVPVADMNLSAGDGIYFAHHVLLWKDPQVDITVMPLSGAFKRMFAGMPLIMTQAAGPGHIAFSRDAPGEMIALPLEPGQEIDVREHLFMVATHSVSYDWFSTNIWLTVKSGDDNETHYPVGAFMDRFSARQTPGLLLLHAAGNVFVRHLAPGQTILVKPSALIFKDPAVQMHLHFERPRMSFTAWGASFGNAGVGNRYMWLRLYGPGRVAVQSVFSRLEEGNQYIQSCSTASEQQW